MNKIEGLLIELYTNYGFEYRDDLSLGHELVFTITQGPFENTIIVDLKGDSKSDLANELNSIGFHVNKEIFSSIKETENKLFSDFFKIKRTKDKFYSDYQLHKDNIINSFPGSHVSYNYIHSPFYKSDVFNEAENDILNDILSEIKIEGPKLILIEAPAGFGKTCTAYEVGKILSENDNEHLVLLAELSRDRHAKIFEHVLNKEVARSFPAVSHSIVHRQIRKGGIIVILDGFDELLNEKEDEEFQFEKSQAMLHTIGSILQENAKVILTTRKTAILQGEDFDYWINENENKFEFIRYSLKEPSVKNWLGAERNDRLGRTYINMKNISNPVLLNFLKFISDEDFESVVRRPESLVDTYFGLILNREIERQTLKLSAQEQGQFLMRLAGYMVEKNRTKIKKNEIIDYLSIKEIDLIENSRSKYDAFAMPTFEAMLEKLSNHALLDRAGTEENIGFVNDFVLGHFISIGLLEQADEWLAEGIFVEAVINACTTKPLSGRMHIWHKLQDSIQFLTDDEKVRFELMLLEKVSGNFKNSQFKSITFDTRDFFTSGSVTSCVFNECIFKNCEINFDLFNDNLFISCQFYDCTTSKENINNSFISCNYDDVFSKNVSLQNVTLNQDVIENGVEDKIRAHILEKFWPIGKDTIAFAHRPMLIFYRNNLFSPQEVTETLDELRREGFLISAKRKNWIGLDLSGHNLNKIKEMLGR